MKVVLNPANVNYGAVAREYLVDQDSLSEVLAAGIRTLKASAFSTTSPDAYATVESVVSSKLVQYHVSDDSAFSVSTREIVIDIIHRVAAEETGVKYGSAKDNKAWLDAWNHTNSLPISSTVLYYKGEIEK